MTKLARVEILGGGPAGLYTAILLHTAILLRRHLPEARVRVTEQNPERAPPDRREDRRCGQQLRHLV